MRHRRLTMAGLAGCTLIAVALPRPASAQGWLDRIKKQAKATIQQRTDQATDSVTNAAFDKAEHVVKCVVSDKTCIKNAVAAGQAVAVVNAQGQAVSTADSASAMAAAGATSSMATAGGAEAPTAAAAAPAAAPAASQPPGTGVWLNYDFVPGDHVLYYEDFANDQVGNLPAHLDVKDGNAAVVDIAGTKYLRTTTGATTIIDLAQPLPQRFTIELTYHRSGGNGMGLYFLIQGPDGKPLHLRCDMGVAQIEGAGASGSKSSQQSVPVGDNDFETCRYMVDGGYVKAYVNDQRVAQLNGLTIGHGKQIEMDVPNANENGALVTNIRIAEGGKPLYDALAANGRVSTHGILFATGSAAIEGESTPTLAEIGQMLKAHPELKLEIDGHTDNVGDATANQTLSEQRAGAVTQYLVANYQIDPSRLSAKGFGASKPVASNDTPEGRQQNRRVELVKL